MAVLFPLGLELAFFLEIHGWHVYGCLFFFFLILLLLSFILISCLFLRLLLRVRLLISLSPFLTTLGLPIFLCTFSRSFLGHLLNLLFLSFFAILGGISLGCLNINVARLLFLFSRMRRLLRCLSCRSLLLFILSRLRLTSSLLFGSWFAWLLRLFGLFLFWLVFHWLAWMIKLIKTY